MLSTPKKSWFSPGWNHTFDHWGDLVLGGLHWIYILNQHSTSVPHTDSSSRSHWTCSLNQQQAALMALFENRVPQYPLVNPCIFPIQKFLEMGATSSPISRRSFSATGGMMEPFLERPGDSVLEWFLQRLGGGGPWSWSLVEPFGTRFADEEFRYFLIKPLIVKDHH